MTVSALEDLLLEHARRLEDADPVAVSGGCEVRLDGEPFAVISNGAAEFRLRPVVAAAALRTPGTAPSVRGPGWVRFEPAALDEFARDRAVAWLESAWRLADEDAEAAGIDDAGAADDAPDGDEEAGRAASRTLS